MNTNNNTNNNNTNTMKPDPDNIQQLMNKTTQAENEERERMAALPPALTLDPETDIHLVIVLHNKRVSYVSRNGTGAMPTLNQTHQECVDYFLETVLHNTYEVIDDRTPESPTPWYDRPIVGPATIRDIAEITGICALFALAVVGLVLGLAL